MKRRPPTALLSSTPQLHQRAKTTLCTPLTKPPSPPHLSSRYRESSATASTAFTSKILKSRWIAVSLPYSKTKMSPNHLALMHTNRMIRFEAGSALYKKVAPFHSFTCPTDQPIEAVMLTRIRDVCSLVSIRDAQIRLSIRCTPNWKDYGGARNSGDDGWRSREVKAFASSALVQV